jgi:hypothetical protein
MEELNIVDLIENNPITKLNGNNYQSKMVTKIKERFTEFEQHMFVSSFYCFLNYNSKTDFVIDLDDVWEWLGFKQKVNAKTLLEKNFIIENDYKISLLLQQEQKKGRGGSNHQKILMTVKTFKTMCLKAGTKKADEIHEYFIKLEEILQEVIQEESTELKLQLETAKTQLEQKDTQSQKEKDILREKTLLEQFSINTQCVYYGRIDNKSVKGEKLIKFGISNCLGRRVGEHKSNFTNFCLINAFKVTNHIQTENGIKQHAVFKKYIRSIQTDKNPNNTELISIDTLSFEDIDEIIKKIIKETEYNVENYNIVLEKNFELEYNIKRIEKDNTDKDQKIAELELKLKDFTPTTSYEEKMLKKLSLTNITTNGYLLYAFEYKKDRYKCGYCRPADLDHRVKIFKNCDPDGEMKLTQKIQLPFVEKNMSYLLKAYLTHLGNEAFEGSLEDIQTIFNIVSKIDEHFSQKNSLEDILNKLTNNTDILNNNILDPEIPQIKKGKRAIDQIHRETGKIIASYPSIESAGLALGLTTGTAIGTALRNKTQCRGYLWRYSGISKEDQMSDQPVIKICCKDGHKTHFNNIADAARDCNISAPGLRNRILTDVHTNNYHWVFDKGSTHYNS